MRNRPEIKTGLPAEEESEKSNKGISFTEAGSCSYVKNEYFTIPWHEVGDTLVRVNILSEEVAELCDLIQKDDDKEFICNTLANCLRLTINTSEAGYPVIRFDIAVWIKSLFNNERFGETSFIKEREGVSFEEALDISKKMYGVASASKLFDGYGLITDPAMIGLLGIGSPDIDDISSLKALQGFNTRFLDGLPHKFTIAELADRLLLEIIELEETPLTYRLGRYIANNKYNFIQRADFSFELADVFIYLIHIATIMELSISDLISRVGIEGYQEKVRGMYDELNRRI